LLQLQTFKWNLRAERQNAQEFQDKMIFVLKQRTMKA